MKFRMVIMLSWWLACSGCVLTSNLQPPKITIVSVSMMSADVFSQQFRIHLHVQNPNSLALPVKSIEYQLFLQGDDFADGTTTQPFVVPAHGEAEFDTLFSTNFVSSIVRLLGTLNDSQDNKVQYTFTGKIHLSKGMMRNIPFNETGKVDLNLKK